MSCLCSQDILYSVMLSILSARRIKGEEFKVVKDM